MPGREQWRRRRREQTDGEPVLDDPTLGWMFVGDRRMFVVGYTEGGAPYGCYEDEFDDFDKFEDEFDDLDEESCR
ncbi:MAG: hypothetical protein ACRDSL_00860 [Pseudonocardiaceae bacterium]